MSANTSGEQMINAWAEAQRQLLAGRPLGQQLRLPLATAG